MESRATFTVSRVLNRGIRWKWVVSFVLWPPYSYEKCPRYSLERRLNVFHSQNEPWKRKISISYLKWTVDTSVVQPSAELSHKLTPKISSSGCHSEGEVGIILLNFCSQIE